MGLLMGQWLLAQQVIITSEAEVKLTGDVNVVLQDMSLVNKSTLDGAGGVVKFNPITTERILETNTPVFFNGFNLGDYGGNFTLYGSLEVNDLGISANSNFTIADTSGLLINTSIASMGNLFVESGGSLIIKPAVTSPGVVTLYRNTTFDNTTGKYSVVGSPIAAAALSDLGVNAQSWIFEYDESTPYGEDGSDRFQTPSESNMIPGKGYFSAFTGDENGIVVFYGTPNYKNVQYAVTLTDNATDASDVEGFNLLSNPFTSPISFDQFMIVNTDVLSEETIWIWDDYSSNSGGGDASSDYITISNLGNTDSRGERLSDWDGSINVGQGFFIKADENNNVVFNHAMKTHDGNDDASYYRVNESEVERYWVSIASDKGARGSNMLVGFTDAATAGFDRKYDASKLGTGFSVYSLMGDRKLAIQGLPVNWLNKQADQSIALGIYVPEAGDYTLNLQESTNPQSELLYLNDHLSGRSVDLFKESYSFHSEAGTYNDRFSLSSSPLSTSTILGLQSHQLDLVVYGISGAIRVRSEVTGHLTIYTMEGKKIMENTLRVGEMEVPVPKGGLYIATVANKDGNASYKVLVKH